MICKSGDMLETFGIQPRCIWFVLGKYKLQEIGCKIILMCYFAVFYLEEVMQKRIDGFMRCHPLVNLVFFVGVIGFGMLFVHPVAQGISLLSAVLYLACLKGRKSVGIIFPFVLPMVLVTALINPIFNHQGITILGYLPGGNPLTLESVLYGLSSGAMLGCIVCWFVCLNEIFTSDKLTYIFGRIAPSLSLIFSMILRFVPRFKTQFAEIAEGQRGIGNDLRKGTFRERARCAVQIFSVMITKSLESSVDVADSMKSRGYGTGKRTAFSDFALSKQDKGLLTLLIFEIFYIAVGVALGRFEFQFIPHISFGKTDAFGVTVYAAYFLLCITPEVVEFLEERKWKQ